MTYSQEQHARGDGVHDVPRHASRDAPHEVARDVMQEVPHGSQRDHPVRHRSRSKRRSSSRRRSRRSVERKGRSARREPKARSPSPKSSSRQRAQPVHALNLVTDSRVAASLPLTSAVVPPACSAANDLAAELLAERDAPPMFPDKAIAMSLEAAAAIAEVVKHEARTMVESEVYDDNGKDRAARKRKSKWDDNGGQTEATIASVNMFAPSIVVSTPLPGAAHAAASSGASGFTAGGQGAKETKHLTVLSSQVGALLGRAGSIITEMREASGCFIKIDQRRGMEEAVVAMTGDPIQISACEAMIADKIQALNEQNDQTWKSSTWGKGVAGWGDDWYHGKGWGGGWGGDVWNANNSWLSAGTKGGWGAHKGLKGGSWDDWWMKGSPGKGKGMFPGCHGEDSKGAHDMDVEANMGLGMDCQASASGVPKAFQNRGSSSAMGDVGGGEYIAQMLSCGVADTSFPPVPSALMDLPLETRQQLEQCQLAQELMSQQCAQSAALPGSMNLNSGPLVAMPEAQMCAMRMLQQGQLIQEQIMQVQQQSLMQGQ